MEQFGTETMPLWPSRSSPFTSGTTSGTSGSMRKAELLSTTKGARLRGHRGKLAADAASRRDEYDVDLGEELRRGRLYGQPVAVEGDLLAYRALRRAQSDLADRKAPFLQDAEEDLPYGARRSD